MMPRVVWFRFCLLLKMGGLREYSHARENEPLRKELVVKERKKRVQSVFGLGAGVGSTNERPGGDAGLNKPNMRTSGDPGDGGDPLVIFLGTIKMMGCGEGVTVLLGSVGFRDAKAGMQGEVLHLMLETPGGKGRWPLCTAAGVTISECGEAG